MKSKLTEKDINRILKKILVEQSEKTSEDEKEDAINFLVGVLEDFKTDVNIVTSDDVYEELIKRCNEILDSSFEGEE
jgi:hypothetical protein